LKREIVQIVPHRPGTHDGVGDYALALAQKLRSEHERETIFAVAASSAGGSVENFRVLALQSFAPAEPPCDIILHYVNYGYQSRGVPFGLLAEITRLRSLCRGKLLTIFHELYAEAPPWKSAFWLRPFQKAIARKLAQRSDACLVSSDVMLRQLRRLQSRASIVEHPVVSTFGEPALDALQLQDRDPHKWVICGGTSLVERSLRSLIERRALIPNELAPRELFIIGGRDNPAVRSLLENCTQLAGQYLPEVDAATASAVLASCAFGWIDYFDRDDIPTAAILKSTAFAACCAHGVIPVFPHRGTVISSHGESLPGPYFVGTSEQHLPPPAERAGVSRQIYEWYQRRASSTHLANVIVATLGAARDA
jgi:hypothetical protein